MPNQSPQVFSPHHHHNYHDQQQYYEYDSQFSHQSYGNNQFRNQKPNQRQQAVGPQNTVNYNNKYSKAGGRGGPPQPPSPAVPFGQHYPPSHMPQVNYGMNYSPYPGHQAYQIHPHPPYFHAQYPQVGPPGFNRGPYNYGHYNQNGPYNAPYNGQVSPTFEEYDNKKSLGPDSNPSTGASAVDSRISPYQSFPMSGSPASTGPVGSSNVMAQHQHVQTQSPHGHVQHPQHAQHQQHQQQPHSQHQQPHQHQLNQSSYKW
jgi:hypothetical protein